MESTAPRPPFPSRLGPSLLPLIKRLRDPITATCKHNNPKQTIIHRVPKQVNLTPVQKCRITAATVRLILQLCLRPSGKFRTHPLVQRRPRRFSQLIRITQMQPRIEKVWLLLRSVIKLFVSNIQMLDCKSRWGQCTKNKDAVCCIVSVHPHIWMKATQAYQLNKKFWFRKFNNWF